MSLITNDRRGVSQQSGALVTEISGSGQIPTPERVSGVFEGIFNGGSIPPIGEDPQGVPPLFTFIFNDGSNSGNVDIKDLQIRVLQEQVRALRAENEKLREKNRLLVDVAGTFVQLQRVDSSEQAGIRSNYRY